METDGGGWIVIQRRDAALGRVNFTRNWEDYENGFCNLDGEFWIGLKNIHELTNQQEVELHISVWNDTNTWNYQTFRVSSPDDRYQLTVSGGTGDGDLDALAYHNGQDFTTYDRDNDCAYLCQGGWWYGQSYNANLNGRHEMSGLPGTLGVGQLLRWYSGRSTETYTNSEMKIRSKICTLDC